MTSGADIVWEDTVGPLTLRGFDDEDVVIADDRQQRGMVINPKQQDRLQTVVPILRNKEETETWGIDRNCVGDAAGVRYDADEDIYYLYSNDFTVKVTGMQLGKVVSVIKHRE